MKLIPTVFALALALAGLVVACGPEETYCYDQHSTCEKARMDKEKAEAERKADEEAARNDGGVRDGTGATVVGQ